MRSTSSSDAYTILLAGQESDNNRSALQILRLDDIRTEGILSGEKALRRQREINDVILLVDLDLPDMPVPDFITRARSLRRSVPIIVIVPEMSKQYTWGLAKLGVNEFIPRDEDFLEMLPDVVLNTIPGRERQIIPSDRSGTRDVQPEKHIGDQKENKGFSAKDFALSPQSKPITAQNDIPEPVRVAESDVQQGSDMIENEKSLIDPENPESEVTPTHPMDDFIEHSSRTQEQRDVRPGHTDDDSEVESSRTNSQTDSRPNRIDDQNEVFFNRSDDRSDVRSNRLDDEHTIVPGQIDERGNAIIEHTLVDGLGNKNPPKEHDEIANRSNGNHKITKRKRTEEAPNDTENRYRIVSSLTSDYAYAFRIEPDGGLINEWVTGAFNTITGFTMEELQALGGWSSLIYPEDIDIPMKQLGLVLKGRPQRCEYRILTKSGEIRWMKDYAQPIWDEEQLRVTHIYGAVQDITAMKMDQTRINSKLRELDILASTAMELVELDADINLYDFIKNKLALLTEKAIVVVSALGRNQRTVEIKAIHGIGKHTGSILKLLHKDPVGMKFNVVDGSTYGLDKGGLVKLPPDLNKLTNGKIPVSVGKAISKVMGIGDIHSIDLNRKGEIFGNITIIMKKGQKLKNVEIIETFVRQASVALQRKMAEDKLIASLKEKNILLKEIHHRVKNNLQIVSSLLNLQASYIDDVKIREIFKESHNRIRSMALVHERLYQTGNFEYLDFDKYLSLLTKNLYRSYVIDPRKIDLEVDIDDISIELNHAIPCGLIITELMSNSLKYAFPVDWQKKGIIRVSLKRSGEDGGIRLTISDNGIGIPASVNIKDSDSLGLHLVRILAEDQLGGRMSIDTEGGTTFTINFNQEEH